MSAADIFLNSIVRRRVFNVSAHNLYYCENSKWWTAQEWNSLSFGMAGSYRDLSSTEVPFHILGTTQISPQQQSSSSATKMHNQKGQNGNFCSAFPTSAGLKPPNAQQPGLHLSKTTNIHQKPPTKPWKRSNPLLIRGNFHSYLTVFTTLLPGISPHPLSENKKINSNLHSEGTNGLSPLSYNRGNIRRCSCHSFPFQGNVSSFLPAFLITGPPWSLVSLFWPSQWGYSRCNTL